MQACGVQEASLAAMIHGWIDSNSPAGRTFFGAEACLDLLNLQASINFSQKSPKKSAQRKTTAFLNLTE